MTFLKKYGLEVLNIVLRVIGIGGPVVAAASGSPAVASSVDTLTKFATIIQDIEAGFTAAFGSSVKTGSAKIAAAQPMVAQVVQDWLAANFPGTAHIQNQALFATAISGYAQATVDLANSLEPNVTTAKIVQASGPAAPASVISPVPTV